MELYMKLRLSEADYLLSKHHTIYNPHQQLLRLPGAQQFLFRISHHW